MYLDHRFEHDKNSPYQILIKTLSENFELEVEVNVYPLKRATKTFITNNVSCIAPTSIETIHKFYKEETKGIKFIESNSIEIVTSRLFSLSGSVVAKKLDDIKGKNVVSWLGIPDKLFLPNVDFNSIKVKSDMQALKILGAKRADFLLGWTPDTPLVAEKLGMDIPKYSKDLVVFSSMLNAVCRDTPENKKFIKHFNKRLRELKKSGELKKILGPYSTIVR